MRVFTIHRWQLYPSQKMMRPMRQLEQQLVLVQPVIEELGQRDEGFLVDRPNRHC